LAQFKHPLESFYMAMNNRLAGHTNSYHTYGLKETLEGIAAAGFRYVELSAVRGWTEQVPLDADAKTLSGIQRLLNKVGLIPVSLSGHSDLTSKDGLQLGLKAIDLCDRLGIDIMNTAIGGHYSENEDEAAFMGNIHQLADYAAERNIMIGIEIHGDITSSAKKAVPVLQKINRDNVRLNYDTANVEFYDGGTKAEDDLPAGLPYLVHCHLKDHRGVGRVWDFPAVGEGEVNFKKLLDIMQKGNFSGPFSVEIEFSGEPWPSLEEVNRSMRQSYQHLSSLGLS
jgi:L-ribulose-5-phosphate 3-epimerase